MTAAHDFAGLQQQVVAFATAIEGHLVDEVRRPDRETIYVRWESRGVQRQIEVQVSHDEPTGVAIWATARKARKDRSLRFATLSLNPEPAALVTALQEARCWADTWKVQDFFG